MSAYLPWTVDYKVRKGLKFAEKMMSPHRHNAPEKYDELKRKIFQCQNGSCPYTKMELRDLADKISPGLGNVDTICKMIDAVKDK